MGKIKIDVDFNWEGGTSYYVLQDQGFVVSEDTGKPSDAITSPIAFTFITNDPPVLDYTTPPDDTIDFKFDIQEPSNKITVTFNENVFRGTGSITLHNTSVGKIQTWDVTDPLVRFDGTNVKLYTDNIIDFTKSHYVVFNEGTIVDDNCFELGREDERNTTAFVANYNENPLQPQNSVSISTFDVTFCQDIQVNEGEVRLYREDNNQLIETFDVSDAVLKGTDALTFTPLPRLNNDYEYYVTGDRGLVIDGNGFQSAAIVKDDTDIITTFNYPLISGLLYMNFNNAVYAGQGSIDLYKENDELVKSFNVGNEAEVTFDTNIVSIEVDLAQGYSYYVLIDDGAIVDIDKIAYGGMPGKTQWNFTVYNAVASDGLTPADDSIDADFSEVSITSDEAFAFEVPGQFTLHNSNGSTAKVYNFPADAALVTGPGGPNSKVLFTHTEVMKSNTDYYFTSDPDLLVDDRNFVLPNITNSTDWNFKTINVDGITSSFPVNGDVEVIDFSNFELTFLPQTLTLTPGKTATLNNSTSVVHTYDLDTDITITNNKVSFPTLLLDYNKEYHLLIEENAFSYNYIGSNGLTNSTDYTFTTKDLPIEVLSPANNSLNNGINIDSFSAVYTDDINIDPTGIMSIKETVSGSVIISVNLNDPLISSGSNFLTLDTSSIEFDESTSYTVNLSPNSLTSNNIKISPIIDEDWVIETAPNIVYVGFNYDLNIDIVTAQITYDESIEARTGFVKLYKNSGNVLVQSWDITTLSITTDGGTGNGIINIPSTQVSFSTSSSTDYYFTIDDGSVVSLSTGAGNTGILDPNTMTFQIVKGPELDSILPSDRIIRSTNDLITLTFDETVKDYTSTQVQVTRVQDNKVYTRSYTQPVDKSIIEVDIGYDLNDADKTFDVTLPVGLAVSRTTDLSYLDNSSTPIVFNGIAGPVITQSSNTSASMTITFDKPVDVLQLAGTRTNFVLTNNANSNEIDWDYTEVQGTGTNTLVFDFNQPLIADTEYTLTISSTGLIDNSSGYYFSGDNRSFSTASSSISSVPLILACFLNISSTVIFTTLSVQIISCCCNQKQTNNPHYQ